MNSNLEGGGQMHACIIPVVRHGVVVVIRLNLSLIIIIIAGAIPPPLL